jgi:pSer/pThr/pTyr-binding forkhead associated (FHA) protein
MKVRLSIAVAPGDCVAFEHPGPVIRIGRDAECELSLQGEASTAVSRQHARIDLSDHGAMLSDSGSSNGTLLNGQMIEGSVPLRVADCIQMGYTGATLTVLELDLSSPAGAHSAGSQRMLISAIASVACVAVVALALIAFGRPGKQDLRQAPQADVPINVKVADTDTSKHGAPASKGDKSEPSALPDSAKPPVALPDTVLTRELSKTAPSEEVREVGAYVALDNWVSVLLQRQGEGYPWTVLRPEAKVSTGQTLISLPGYRSLIALDSGVRLTLWGNLPEFSAFPPVFESVAMLHDPASGFDLDFTLDRGRVVVSNRKAAGGPVQIRVRFMGEIWDLELPGAESAAGLELWALPGGQASNSSSPEPVMCLGLFAKGRVRVKTPLESLDLGDRSRLSWVSRESAVLHRMELAEPPSWWAKPPERTAPQVQKALRSLLDWSDHLGGSNTDPARKKAAASEGTPVVTRIKTQVEEVSDADNQDVGVFFLAALDELEPLVDLLRDRQNPNVRGATLFALQSWLSRGAQHAGRLTQLLEQRRYSKDKAELIIRLLHFFPPEALNQVKTYEDVIGHLDDDTLLVRDLAFWHLDQLGRSGRLPAEARTIHYDPSWETDKRRPAVEQWKKLITAGKVPVTSRR